MIIERAMPLGVDTSGLTLYDIAKLASTLPYGFYNGSAVVYNNEIHILGGDYDSATYKNHYKYNGSSWTKVSTLPYQSYNGEAVVCNNEIHILGGGSSDNCTKHYNIATYYLLPIDYV